MSARARSCWVFLRPGRSSPGAALFLAPLASLSSLPRSIQPVRRNGSPGPGTCGRRVDHSQYRSGVPLRPFGRVLQFARFRVDLMFRRAPSRSVPLRLRSVPSHRIGPSDRKYVPDRNFGCAERVPRAVPAENASPPFGVVLRSVIATGPSWCRHPSRKARQAPPRVRTLPQPVRPPQKPVSTIAERDVVGGRWRAPRGRSRDLSHRPTRGRPPVPRRNGRARGLLSPAAVVRPVCAIG